MAEPLLAGLLDPARPLLVGDAQTQTVGALLDAAHALQHRLPSSALLVNRCQSHHGFVLTLLAALLGGHRLELPASASADALNRLLLDAPDALIIDDNWLAANSPTVTPASGWRTPAPPAAGQVGLRAYTSGSSGQAQAFSHHWLALLTRAQASSRQLGLDAALNLVCTAPLQHLYGLEFGVLACLVGQARLYARRPLFGADLTAACSRVDGPWALITTPLHLRSFVRHAPQLRPPALILSATAPLDPALAAQAEAVFAAPVHEIYGCSEAGSLAWRRSVDGPWWTPHPQLGMTPLGEQGYLLFDPFESRGMLLGDCIDVRDDGRFQLLGRADDGIKIAGKRSSLSELTAALLAVPGTTDAVVFLPDRDDPAVRPAALVVNQQLDADQILAALAQRLDPALLPRPLRRLDRLPRNEVGKLPRAALLAALDRP